MVEFQDRFGRPWTVRVGGLRAHGITELAVGHDTAASIRGDLSRPGLRLAVHGMDGRTIWSTWVPFPTLEAATQASDDPTFLQRVVDELYYHSRA